MPDRDDILTELGLTPVWRLRARGDGRLESGVDAATRGDARPVRRA